LFLCLDGCNNFFDFLHFLLLRLFLLLRFFFLLGSSLTTRR
jgi:hypothetical protein